MTSAKRLHVATSPLTNTIFVGNVLKDGLTWGANQQDVTGEACNAVAELVANRGVPVVVTCNGEPIYEITVRTFKRLPEPTKFPPTPKF